MRCMCEISDCITHDAIAVHIFTKVILKYLSQIQPQLSKLFYFTDRTASQCRNFKNINNLLDHESEFSLKQGCNLQCLFGPNIFANSSIFCWPPNISIRYSVEQNQILSVVFG